MEYKDKCLPKVLFYAFNLLGKREERPRNDNSKWFYWLLEQVIEAKLHKLGILDVKDLYVILENICLLGFKDYESIGLEELEEFILIHPFKKDVKEAIHLKRNHRLFPF